MMAPGIRQRHGRARRPPRLLGLPPPLPECCVEGGVSRPALLNGEGEQALVVDEPRICVVDRSRLGHVGLPSLGSARPRRPDDQMGGDV
jgi:hypothetical protein